MQLVVSPEQTAAFALAEHARDEYVLRARGQGLELSDVSPEMGLAQRSGTIVSRLAGADQAGAGDSTRGPRDARRSGMPSMPGAAAPAVKQPVLSDDGAADSAAPEQKEEK